MITVLHITPHLGGGVGKALSGLIMQSRISESPVKHVVICLEQPEKNQFLDLIGKSGSEVIVSPDRLHLDELLAAADIVQLEWWNHPATIQCLCNLSPQPIRLLVWCHVSGLYNPIIPPGLLKASNHFLLTSPCSYEAKEVSDLTQELGCRVAVVSSGGGFDGFPKPSAAESKKLSVGYLGSLNFAKLNPDYVDFLSAVKLPGFTVRLIGDLLNQEVLAQQCGSIGREELLEFHGYTTNVAAELSRINVLAYLLNPRHYGTAENALLEAMAMGVVPVVLDNPCERQIVEHLRTGLIVSTPAEFSDAITWLDKYPEERSKIGLQAAETVRTKFTLENMVSSFGSIYEQALTANKATVLFQDIFGRTPDEWFLSCQGEPELFGKDGDIHRSSDKEMHFDLFEKTKGSVFHFHRFFPENQNLARWSTGLNELSEANCSQ